MSAPSGGYLVSLATLAKEWDMPESTLRTWRARGYGPQSFRRGGSVVYRRSVLDAWLAQQEQESKRGGDA